jgi:hypothetical protein
MDYSPAAVAHARTEAATRVPACHYRLADIRDAAYGSGFRLAMLIVGELNVFPCAVASHILSTLRAGASAGRATAASSHATRRCPGSLPTTSGARSSKPRHPSPSATGDIDQARRLLRVRAEVTNSTPGAGWPRPTRRA